MGQISTHSFSGLESFDISGFRGINRKENGAANEFSDIVNISPEKYPCLSPVCRKELSEEYNSIDNASNIRAVAAPCTEKGHNGFCGVVGTDFYYAGRKKEMKKPAVYEDGEYQYGMEISEDGKIQLLRANQILIIHGYDCAERKPYVYYYDTSDFGTADDFVKSYEYQKEAYYTPMEMDISTDGTATIEYTYQHSGSFAGEYFDFKAGDSVFIDGVMSYYDSRFEKPSLREITSAVVTEYSETYNRTYQGNEIWDIVIKLKLLNYKGENPIKYSAHHNINHICKKIPYMTHMAVHKGRLWGANPNGEYVYASALNDLFNFSQFDGLADDSVFLESSSQGGYIGVFSCRDALLTFKKDETEVIYGELPSEFAVGKSYEDCGCIDMKSCISIDGILYYLGTRGFFAWDGSRPRLISEELKEKFKSAAAFTDGQKYFASALSQSGNVKNFVYTPKYAIWTAEDDTQIDGYFRENGDLYVLASDRIYKYASDMRNVSWELESTKLFGADFKLNRINEVWLDVKFEKDSELEFYSSSDGERWQFCKRIGYDDKRKFKTYRIPVRPCEGFFWKYKMKGVGPCVIYRMQIISHNSGRSYE